MSPFVRQILAIAAALIVAYIVAHGIETIAQQVHPCPTNVDCTDPAALKRALEAGQIPVIKYGLVLAGWLLAAYAAGLTAIRISNAPQAVWLVAILICGSVYTKLSSSHHPSWMWWGGLAGCLLFALGGGRQSLAVKGVR